MQTRMFARYLNDSLLPYSSDYKMFYEHIQNIIDKIKS
jgi:hypothetical protein